VQIVSAVPSPTRLDKDRDPGGRGPASGAAAFIETRDLRKTYHIGKIKVEALRGISFSVQKGEFVSVVGPSGSGKSTLFYVLGGLTRADSGSVILDGQDWAALSDAERTRLRRRKIGFVFQRFNLLPTLDARSNILIAQEIAGNGDRDLGYFNRITELLGLRERLGHLPAELSGGEQQRVALARALINQPAVVLADEPTGSLDSKNSEVVLRLLRQSNKELRQTVLMITHNPEAAKYADRIIHMRDGQIVKPEEDPQWMARQ
jgi:putative ABC transport system ATP-binding protein